MGKQLDQDEREAIAGQRRSNGREDDALNKEKRQKCF
jgi:hypothetical protein